MWAWWEDSFTFENQSPWCLFSFLFAYWSTMPSELPPPNISHKVETISAQLQFHAQASTKDTTKGKAKKTLGNLNPRTRSSPSSLSFLRRTTFLFFWLFSKNMTPSVQWCCHRHIVGSLHHYMYVLSTSSANFRVILGPLSSYQTWSCNKPFHSTPLLHLPPLSLCNHSHTFPDMAIYRVSTTQTFISPHAHFHFTMCFLIFDIISTMCLLPSYKPLCFSPSYLNIEYLSCHSQFWIST